jgi:signal transduction histidine kinase
MDVTDMKRSEMAIKEAKARAELYLDLMGHDINNMRQAALGYLELTAELQEDENMRELLERLRDVLLRSARLVDNVRKLQKLQEGQYPNKPVEIVRILADVLTEYDAVPGKFLALYTHGIDRGFVEANELLYDVFANLVSNAIKHSGSHARVTIHQEQVQESSCSCRRCINNRTTKRSNNAKKQKPRVQDAT